MLFTIILVCSLYYVVCFYVAHKTFFYKDAMLSNQEHFWALLLCLTLCPFAPILLLIIGWVQIHKK